MSKTYRCEIQLAVTTRVEPLGFSPLIEPGG